MTANLCYWIHAHFSLPIWPDRRNRLNHRGFMPPPSRTGGIGNLSWLAASSTSTERATSNMGV